MNSRSPSLRDVAIEMFKTCVSPACAKRNDPTFPMIVVSSIQARCGVGDGGGAKASPMAIKRACENSVESRQAAIQTATTPAGLPTRYQSHGSGSIAGSSEKCASVHFKASINESSTNRQPDFAAMACFIRTVAALRKAD